MTNNTIPGNNWAISGDNDIIPFNSKVDGTSLTSTGGILSTGPTEVRSVNIVTGAGDVTCSATENYLIINKNVGQATAVVLPTNPQTGMRVIIKDGKGDAATNNITVNPASGLIDAGNDYIMNVNFQALRLIFNGTNWSIV